MLTKNNASANEEASGSIPIGDVGTEPEEILIDDDILFQSEPKPKKFKWRSLTLRTKATLLAIAISTIPVVLIGGVAAYLSSVSLEERIRATQLQKTNAIVDKINRFVYERYGDIQVLAAHPIITNPKVQAVLPQTEREAVLNDYTATYGVYDLVAFANLNGITTIRSTSTQDPNASIKDSDFFKNVLAKRTPFITQPVQSATDKSISLIMAAPVKENGTDKLIGVMRSQIPIDRLGEILEGSINEQDDYHILDGSGKIILAKEKSQENRQAQNDFPKLAGAINAKTSATEQLVDKFNGKEQVVTYVPLSSYRNMPNLDIGILVALDVDFAFRSNRDIIIAFATGTGLTALVVGFLATLLVNRGLKPIQNAADVVTKIGQGDLDTRMEVVSEDELGILSININAMAEQLKYLSDIQQQEAERLENARQEARAEADERAEQQKQEKEFLQRRALELLMEVDPVSRGDLTIRANVTADEVGTIADSYNAIIRNLRKLVMEVQEASISVSQTATSKEMSVRSVSNEALKQSESINSALQEVKVMAESSRGVENKAKQAEQEMQVTVTFLQEGNEAMNRTVEGISEIRETVSETAKKVKRLGETSQKISRIVNLISNFAAQTNLLALNAAIEAARAGEEGRGFSVVAEEVRDLAEQSAASTAEIEQLVEEIQAQTNEVVSAMETGTEQVVIGTKLVQNAREKLDQIATVSRQVNSIVREIAIAADMQTQTSDRMGETMQGIAAIAEDTSKQSEDVAKSFAELLQVAQDLQVSVAQFKVA